jgi:3-deoxy-D-manno-octulosonic-acid transferase
MGETKSSFSFIHEMRKDLKNAYIVFATSTQTGFNEAKKNPFVDQVVFMPFDFSFSIKRLFKQIKPKIVIFVETDFWYNFLKFSKKNNSKIVLISGKISEKSEKNFKKFSFFSKKLFSFFDFICTQNDVYKKRFINLGISKEKIYTTGNIKYDQQIHLLSNLEQKTWKKKLKIEDNFVITIASTHYPEEKLLLESLKDVLNTNIKILLAPRHPERFEAVKKLLIEKSFNFVTYSKLEITGLEKIILIDTIGFLNIAYQLSDLAILGGSFIERVGGHNILEPVLVNTPVFFGPHMHSQLDLKKLILEKKCGKEVTLSTLKPHLQDFFKNKSLCDNCKNLNFIKGSSKKTWDLISKILD